MWDTLRTPPSLATLFPGLPVGETAGWSVVRRSPNLSEPHIVEPLDRFRSWLHVNDTPLDHQVYLDKDGTRVPHIRGEGTWHGLILDLPQEPMHISRRRGRVGKAHMERGLPHGPPRTPRGAEPPLHLSRQSCPTAAGEPLSSPVVDGLISSSAGSRNGRWGTWEPFPPDSLPQMARPPWKHRLPSIPRICPQTDLLPGPFPKTPRPHS
ncbi:hypothetical protein EDB80DRAFT_101059 [Ilyonectria destructans]|nr:hypothetical protein EDB80DRAFT_101059 [Ilyonectria destructans]